MAEEAGAQRGDGGGESTFTVTVAAVAGLGIALAEAVAGFISASSAMPSVAVSTAARVDGPASGPKSVRGRRFPW